TSAGRLAFTKARTSAANFCSSGVNARSIDPSRFDAFGLARSLAARPDRTTGLRLDAPRRGTTLRNLRLTSRGRHGADRQPLAGPAASLTGSGRLSAGQDGGRHRLTPARNFASFASA